MLTVEIDERTASAVVIASLRRSIRLADEMLAGMDASLADSQTLFSNRMALLQVLDFYGGNGITTGEMP
jgi:hypothetical protein